MSPVGENSLNKTSKKENKDQLQNDGKKKKTKEKKHMHLNTES